MSSFGKLAFNLYQGGMRDKYRILSIDGGGLKGLIAIKILQTIETITGSPTGEQFDFLAGTSTGGLIACALSSGPAPNAAAYNLEHIEALYLQVAQDIFMQDGLQYNGREVEKMEKVLADTFGGERLSSTRKPVYIPTWDQERKKLVSFRTRLALSDYTRDVPLTQVCRATTAIEPVFPAYSMFYHGRTLKCIDAGHHLKNPALCALAEVWNNRDHYGSGITEKDLVLLSVSTGTHRSSGADWSTDINTIMGSQRLDMEYIRKKKINLDFSKVKFMRVDLNLEGPSFSLNQLLTWLARIESLSKNKKFIADVYELLVGGKSRP